MKDEKFLGKIESVDIKVEEGFFGLYIALTSNPLWVMSKSTTWNPETVKVSPYTKWTEEDRDADLVHIMRKIASLMNDAGVSTLSELKNIPVELHFINGRLDTWRILKEVL